MSIIRVRPSRLILAAAVVALAVFVLAACGESRPEKPRFHSFGRTLDSVVSPPEFTDRIGVQLAAGHFVIRSSHPSKRLALVKITLINKDITVAPLLIDTGAAQLGSSRGERIFALNPNDAMTRVDVAAPDEDKFTPFFWGEVELIKGYQASGWMVFEIPAGLEVDTLWWNEADDIIVRL